MSRLPLRLFGLVLLVLAIGVPSCQAVFPRKAEQAVFPPQVEQSVFQPQVEQAGLWPQVEQAPPFAPAQPTWAVGQRP
jgi:hypothetical protein